MSKFHCLSFKTHAFIAYFIIFTALNLLCSAPLFAAVDESQAQKMGEVDRQKSHSA
jgi:hypothetical protein